MPPVEAAHPAAAMRLSGLDGRVADVTGASSGIGRCVAETLAALGCRVAGIDLSAGSPAAHASYAGDVSDERDLERCFAQIEQDVGSPELLVTCAGIFQETPIAELGAERWRQTLEVNLTGTFLCARRALPSMRERRFGRIVTLSSGAGIDGGAEACAHYAASKGGVIALTKALSKEVAREGVTVNAVAPRVVRTPMIAGMEDDLLPHIPVGRLGEPDDVAGAVAFLCSGHAGYVTGEVFVLNGGWW
ncbi:MAG: 3-oxoacyl-[acyl-carrier protein] reductase [Pseudonocardiales bacterium]|nr:3-oxoacyl-[acyl-carrier protein] reductase [Pseudonocardiales bacterium]